MVFGRTGLLLHQRARGIDFSPVQPPTRTPQVRESETLAEDSNDYFVLRGILFRLIEQGARHLRSTKMCAGRLVIELRYSDNKEERGQQRFQATNLDHDLFAVAEPLLKKVLTRRIRVRHLSIRLCDLGALPRQLSLFQETAPAKEQQLTAAMDKIRNKYGEKAINFGWAA
jgi:DNA polymerase-4